MKKLKITIDSKGEVSVTVENIAGASCVEATKFLEDALGGKVASRELTADYYAGALPEHDTLTTENGS